MTITGIHGLKLVRDRDFIMCLIPSTFGRLLDMFGRALELQWNWACLLDKVVTVFFPSRLREGLTRRYLTRRFQSKGEIFSDFITAQYRANQILKYFSTEGELIDFIIQNLKPSMRTHLIYSSKPSTMSELFELGHTVNNSVIAESQRPIACNRNQFRPNNASLFPAGYNRHIKKSKSHASESRTSSQLKCWACGQIGHIRAHCRSRRRSHPQGNEAGI
jgi:hypothetical protein